MSFDSNYSMIGRKLFNGEFEIIEFLGKGGFAHVYLGRQLSLMRDVAIKILSEEYIHDEELVKHFHHEANLIAKLNHENIIKIYFSGREEDVHYYVMDLHYNNLSKLLKEKTTLSVAEWTNISIDVATALEYASTKFEGFIHRDIKPGNILIGDKGKAILADFGLAKGDPSSVKTLYAVTAGYMSPEQYYNQNLDKQTDIYSFGVVMYQMITGVAPADHLVKPVEPPHKIVPGLSKDVENIILKALEKNKEKRYKSAGELLQDLEQIKYKEISKKIYPSVEKPVRKIDKIEPQRKFPKWLIPVAAIFVVLLVAVIAFWASAPKGMVLINSSPGGAKIVFDNIVLDEITPCELNKVKWGAHKLQLILPEYDPWDTTFVLDKNNPYATCKVTFQTQMPSIQKGSLVVLSTPSPADVLLDNVPIGTTPLKLNDIPVGWKRVELVKPGFNNHVEDVQIKDGQTMTLDVQLEKISYVPPTTPVAVNKGKLRLSVIPQQYSYTIDINGHVYQKGANKLFEARLVPGSYTIKITHDLYGSCQKTIQIKENGTVDETCYFIAYFNIQSFNKDGYTIPDAKILLDGVDTGNTTPLDRLPIAPGNHTLVVQHNSYGRGEQKVTVQPSFSQEPHILKFTLQ